MSTRRYLGIATFAITALLLCASSQAQEKGSQCPPRAKQEIANAYPSLSSDAYECTRGDLDRDGVADVAAIIQYTNDEGEIAQVLILKGSRTGSYSIIAKSDVYGPHLLREERVLIRRGSVFLTANTHSYDEYDVTSSQFKLIEREFVLIELDQSSGKIGKNSISFSRNVNFATRKVIETRRDRGKPMVEQRRMENPRHIRLEEVSLDNLGGMIFE